MYLNMDGMANTVRLELFDDGGASVSGPAKHYFHGECFALDHVDGARAQIGAAACVWQLSNSLAPEAAVDGLGLGVWKQFRENPTLSLAQVTYYGPDTPLIGVSILLPDVQFEKVWRIFENGLMNPHLAYAFQLKVYLRVPGAETPNPTVSEWMSADFLERRAIITSEVSIGFRNLKDHIELNAS